MKQEEIKYKPLVCNITPVYRFIDGDDAEVFWVDAHNCAFYTYNNSKYSKKTRLIDGKNWWILWPYIPENVETIDKKDNIKDKAKWLAAKAKWFVDDSSRTEDIDKEWDFEKHKIIEV